MIILVVQTGWHTLENIYMRMVMVISEYTDVYNTGEQDVV